MELLRVSSEMREIKEQLVLVLEENANLRERIKFLDSNLLAVYRVAGSEIKKRDCEISALRTQVASLQQKAAQLAIIASKSDTSRPSLQQHSASSLISIEQLETFSTSSAEQACSTTAAEARTFSTGVNQEQTLQTSADLLDTCPDQQRTCLRSPDQQIYTISSDQHQPGSTTTNILHPTDIKGRTPPINLSLTPPSSLDSGEHQLSESSSQCLSALNLSDNAGPSRNANESTTDNVGIQQSLSISVYQNKTFFSEVGSMSSSPDCLNKKYSSQTSYRSQEFADCIEAQADADVQSVSARTSCECDIVQPQKSIQHINEDVIQARLPNCADVPVKSPISAFIECEHQADSIIVPQQPAVLDLKNRDLVKKSLSSDSLGEPDNMIVDPECSDQFSNFQEEDMQLPPTPALYCEDQEPMSGTEICGASDETIKEISVSNRHISVRNNNENKLLSQIVQDGEIEEDNVCSDAETTFTAKNVESINIAQNYPDHSSSSNVDNGVLIVTSIGNQIDVIPNDNIASSDKVCDPKYHLIAMTVENTTGAVSLLCTSPDDPRFAKRRRNASKFASPSPRKLSNLCSSPPIIPSSPCKSRLGKSSPFKSPGKLAVRLPAIGVGKSPAKALATATGSMAVLHNKDGIIEESDQQEIVTECATSNDKKLCLRSDEITSAITCTEKVEEREGKQTRQSTRCTKRKLSIDEYLKKNPKKLKVDASSKVCDVNNFDGRSQEQEKECTASVEAEDAQHITLITCSKELVLKPESNGHVNIIKDLANTHCQSNLEISSLIALSVKQLGNPPRPNITIPQHDPQNCDVIKQGHCNRKVTDVRHSDKYTRSISYAVQKPKNQPSMDVNDNIANSDRERMMLYVCKSDKAELGQIINSKESEKYRRRQNACVAHSTASSMGAAVSILNQIPGDLPSSNLLREILSKAMAVPAISTSDVTATDIKAKKSVKTLTTGSGFAPSPSIFTQRRHAEIIRDKEISIQSQQNKKVDVLKTNNDANMPVSNSANTPSWIQDAKNSKRKSNKDKTELSDNKVCPTDTQISEIEPNCEAVKTDDSNKVDNDIFRRDQSSIDVDKSADELFDFALLTEVASPLSVQSSASVHVCEDNTNVDHSRTDASSMKRSLDLDATLVAQISGGKSSSTYIIAESLSLLNKAAVKQQDSTPIRSETSNTKTITVMNAKSSTRTKTLDQVKCKKIDDLIEAVENEHNSPLAAVVENVFEISAGTEFDDFASTKSVKSTDGYPNESSDEGLVSDSEDDASNKKKRLNVGRADGKDIRQKLQAIASTKQSADRTEFSKADGYHERRRRSRSHSKDRGTSGSHSRDRKTSGSHSKGRPSNGSHSKNRPANRSHSRDRRGSRSYSYEKRNTRSRSRDRREDSKLSSERSATAQQCTTSLRSPKGRAKVADTVRNARANSVRRSSQTHARWARRAAEAARRSPRRCSPEKLNLSRGRKLSNDKFESQQSRDFRNDNRSRRDDHNNRLPDDRQTSIGGHRSVYRR